MSLNTLSKAFRARSSENPTRAIASFLIFWAILFGIVLRLMPIAQSSFPLNDGGLFYRMASDLIENHYRLPAYTGYNDAGIPFAYPPLGIYVLALLAQVFPQLTLVQWLPFVYSALSIAAFYWLAQTIWQDPVKTGLATVAFALVPSSTDILLWGGGVTRGLGFLFCILAAQSLIRLFRDQQWKTVIPASLLAALVVLSHPTAAYITALFAAVCWVWYGRNVRSAAQAAAVAGGVLALTLPWWLTVIQNHGLGAFHAGLTSGWFTQVFVPFITLNTTQEPLMTVVMVVGFIGLLYALYQKRLFLPLWFFACLLSQRDGYVYASIPISLLFGSAMIDLIVPAFSKAGRDAKETRANVFFGGSRWLVTFFLIYSLINAVLAAEKIRPIRVTPAEQEAMAWVVEHTPADARFLLLTFGDPLNTPFQEWFPAITQRASLTAVQGTEWLPDSTFSTRKNDYNALQACLTRDFACVEHWVRERQLSYDYVLVHQGFVGALQANPNDAQVNQWISAELSEIPGYRRVFQSAWIEIFQHEPAAGAS